jgi:hypothetical protein
MASLTAGQRAAEEKIKAAIVDGCKRGVCDSNGGHIPPENRGMAGKGSHFIGTRPDEQYRRNYVEVFGHS